MGVVSTVAIFSFICLVLVYQTDGAGMTLSSNSASVGQPVILQCVYDGSSTPVTLNFYLGSDIIGLQIYVPVCSYASSTGYDITLYDKNCGAKAVNLTIKSAAASDNGKTWQCDASFFSGPSEAKVSTTITVTAESSGFSTGLTAGAIAGIVIAVVFFLLVHVILIILIIRHCCHGLSKGALIGIVITSVLFAAVEVPLIYVIFQYCCKKNPDSSQPDKKINSTKNKKSPVEPGTGKQHGVTPIKTTSSADIETKPIKTFDPSERRPLPSGLLPSLTNRNGNVNQPHDGGQQNLEEPKKKKKKQKDKGTTEEGKARERQRSSQEDSEVLENEK